MKNFKLFIPLMFALLLSTEVMAGVGCTGLHNYLDLVLNKNKSASRALEVQSRINNLMADGAEVSIESASGLKRVTVQGYENGELLYRVEGSDDVIRQTIDDDFNSFFKLADEIRPTVTDDLADGVRLTDVPAAAERTTDVPAARTTDVPAASRVSPELSLVRTGPDDTYVPIPPERSLVPVRDDGPGTALVPVRDDGPGTALVPVRDDGPGTALVPVRDAPVLTGTGTDLAIRPTGTDVIVRPSTDLAVITPADDALEVAGRTADGPVMITGPPAQRLLPAGDNVLPMNPIYNRWRTMVENSLPILQKSDFPEGSIGRYVEIASPTGRVKHQGEILDISERSIRIRKPNGDIKTFDFRDYNAMEVKLAHTLDGLRDADFMELPGNLSRRRAPTPASFEGTQGKQIVIFDSAAGRVTYSGVIEEIGPNGVKISGRDTPVSYRRIDAKSIYIADDAQELESIMSMVGRSTDAPARVTDVPARTTDLPARTTDVAARTTDVPARTTDVPARTTDVPARTTDGAVTLDRIDRVYTRRATTDVPPGRAIIDNDTGEIFEEVGTALIGGRRPSTEVSRIRAVGGEKLLDAADEFALAAEDIIDSVSEARRFADEVKLPATSNDLLGAFKDKFVRIKIGDGDEVVEGVLRRIDGNEVILDANGTVRRIQLPDFNPDRFVLGNVDELLKADSSVVFVDKAGRAIQQFDAIDASGKIIPDNAVLAALNKGARFRRMVRSGADHFLEFIHNGKKIRIPRRILKRANIAIRRNKAIIGDATFNFVRSGRSARAGEESLGGDSTPAGATAVPANATERPETATDQTPPGATETPPGTSFETPYANDGGETEGETTAGRTTDAPAADPYSVNPNQSFFGAAKSLIKQGWTSLQGLW